MISKGYKSMIPLLVYNGVMFFKEFHPIISRKNLSKIEVKRRKEMFDHYRKTGLDMCHKSKRKEFTTGLLCEYQHFQLLIIEFL
jgi:hypothetical protein